MKFDYSQSQPLNGILAWLFKTNRDSYYQNVIVSVSSWKTQIQIPKYAIDFDTSTYWISGGQHEEEYIDIYLPYHKVKLNGFLIQTSNIGPSEGYHPLKWAFAISNNNHDFNHMKDFEDTNSELKGPLKTKFNSYESNYVQYFRLYTKNNTKNNYHGFDIAQIEFFGHVKAIFSFCEKKSIFRHSILFIILFLEQSL